MKIPNLKELAKDRVKAAEVIVFAALAFLAYLLLIQTDAGTFIKLNNARRLARQDIEILKRASDYESLIKQFDSEFTDDKGANWFMDRITRMAGQEGVILQSLKPLDSASKAGYRIIRIRAEGRSGYLNMVRFINKLEGFEKYIFIESFTFGAGNASAYAELTGFPGDRQSRGASAQEGPIIGSFELTVSSFATEK